MATHNVAALFARSASRIQWLLLCLSEGFAHFVKHLANRSHGSHPSLHPSSCISRPCQVTAANRSPSEEGGGGGGVGEMSESSCLPAVVAAAADPRCALSCSMHQRHSYDSHPANLSCHADPAAVSFFPDQLRSKLLCHERRCQKKADVSNFTCNLARLESRSSQSTFCPAINLALPLIDNIGARIVYEMTETLSALARGASEAARLKCPILAPEISP